MSKFTGFCLVLLCVYGSNAYYARDLHSIDSSDVAVIRDSNGRQRIVPVVDRPDSNFAMTSSGRIVQYYDQPDMPDNIIFTGGMGGGLGQSVGRSYNSGMGRTMNNGIGRGVMSTGRTTHYRPRTSYPRTYGMAHMQRHFGRKKRHALMRPFPFMHPMMHHPMAAMAHHRARMMGAYGGYPMMGMRHPMFGMRSGMRAPGAPRAAKQPVVAQATAQPAVQQPAPQQPIMTQPQPPAMARQQSVYQQQPQQFQPQQFQPQQFQPQQFQDVPNTVNIDMNTIPVASAGQQNMFQRGPVDNNNNNNQIIYTDSKLTNQFDLGSLGNINDLTVGGNTFDFAGAGTTFDIVGSANANDFGANSFNSVNDFGATGSIDNFGTAGNINDFGAAGNNFVGGNTIDQLGNGLLQGNSNAALLSGLASNMDLFDFPTQSASGASLGNSAGSQLGKILSVESPSGSAQSTFV